MTYIAEALRRQTEIRANHRCEYCHLREENSYFTHEIDHIYAEKHGGTTESDNLCLACSVCNRFKGSDLCSLDAETGELVALFHPRYDNWDEHFHLLANGTFQAFTAQARVTIRILHINSVEQVNDRLQLMSLKIWDNG